MFAVLVDVGYNLFFAARDANLVTADRQDSGVAAVGSLGDFAAVDLNGVVQFVINNNVIAVARVVNEDVRAVAALEAVITGAADDCIIAVAAQDCILAVAAVNVIVLFGADNAVCYGACGYRYAVFDCRAVNRLDGARIIAVVGNVEGVFLIGRVERYARACLVESYGIVEDLMFHAFRVNVVDDARNVAALNRDIALAIALDDSEDNIVAACLGSNGARRYLNRIFGAVVSDNVIAVAVVVNEDVRAVAALEAVRRSSCHCPCRRRLYHCRRRRESYLCLRALQYNRRLRCR